MLVIEIGLSWEFLLLVFAIGGGVGALSLLLPQRRAKALTNLIIPMLLMLLLLIAITDRGTVDSGPVELLPENEGVGQRQDVASKRDIIASNDVDDNIHFIFSSSCSDFQQWQSELVFHTHLKVGQKGRITRLVSGCDNAGANVGGFAYLPGQSVKDKAVIKRSTNDGAMVHVTPYFPESKACPFVNKPMSVNHWVQSAPREDKHGKRSNEETVILIDPDQIFLAPFSVKDPKIFAGMDLSKGAVRPKKPIAQMYAIGSRWKNDFNDMPYVKEHFPGLSFVEGVCGKGSPCARATDRQIYDGHQVGPPYMIHWSDISELAPLWARYTPAFANVTENSLYTEMWAYAAATANLEMPHKQMIDFMVSYPTVGSEAWGVIDSIPDHKMSCHNPTHSDDLPPLLHFCHNYRTSDSSGLEWMFHKGHVPQNILDCDMPLLVLPPDNFFNTQGTTEGRRNAWMICSILTRLNAMLADYKQKFCQADVIDLRHRIRLHNPENKPPCSAPKTCHHFYMIDPK